MSEGTQRTRFRQDVPDHAAFRFVPFAVEACGYMGKEAVKFVNRLGDTAAENGRIPKGAFVRCGSAAAVGDGAEGGGMLRCSAGVAWSSRVSTACVMMLVLQCQC